MALRWAGLFVLIISVMSGGASPLNCTVRLFSNGSALYEISKEAKPNCEEDWAINNTVVAHRDDYNKSLVLQQTAVSILLKDYYPSTTYRVDCLKGLHKVLCKGPIFPSDQTELSHDDKKNTWIVISAVMVAIGILCVCGISLIIRRKKGWLQKAGEVRGDLNPEEGAHLNRGVEIV